MTHSTSSLNPAQELDQPIRPKSASGPAASTPALGKTLLHVAWMAIVLGLMIEAVILVVAASFGKAIQGKPLVADLVQKVSWSIIVCVGLALAKGATRLLMSLAAPVMGAAGLLVAPVAFVAARSLHEGLQEAMLIKVLQSGSGSPLLVALIKGVEYGCLGALLGWIAQRDWGKAMAHAGGGFVIGIVFGSALLVAMIWDARTALPASALLPRALNELINPVGCSLTLYAADLLGRARPPLSVAASG